MFHRRRLGRLTGASEWMHVESVIEWAETGHEEDWRLTSNNASPEWMCVILLLSIQYYNLFVLVAFYLVKAAALQPLTTAWQWQWRIITTSTRADYKTVQPNGRKTRRQWLQQRCPAMVTKRRHLNNNIMAHEHMSAMPWSLWWKCVRVCGDSGELLLMTTWNQQPGYW